MISDQHARIERLDQCLDEIGALGIERVWSLGDLVGYGDDAAMVVKTTRERCELSLKGNHDASVVGEADWFYELIPDWLKLTHRRARAQLDQDHLDWIKSLKPAARRDGVCLYHGSFSDPLFGSSEDFEEALRIFSSGARISLVGHTHLPLAMGYSGGREVELIQPAGGEAVDLTRRKQWILNPGTSGLYQSDRWPDNVPPKTRAGRENQIDRRSGWMELSDDRAVWHRFGPTPSPRVTQGD